MKLHFSPGVHWNPAYQLIQPNLNAPMESQGDILENTGLLLTYWALTDPDKLYKKVIAGIEGLKFSGGIALTKYLGLLEPKESTPNRWIQENGFWYRQDISHSQAWYLIFGLNMIYNRTGYRMAKDLADWYARLIANNGWKVGTTSKGNFLDFPPLGNHLLKAWSVSGYTEKPFISKRAIFSIRLMWLWTWLYARLGKYGPTDINNTAFILYALNEQDLSYRFKKWNVSSKANANLAWLRDRYDNNKPDNPDVIQNDLKFLNRMLMI